MNEVIYIKFLEADLNKDYVLNVKLMPIHDITDDVTRHHPMVIQEPASQAQRLV